jgi:hypothetical protein
MGDKTETNDQNGTEQSAGHILGLSDIVETTVGRALDLPQEIAD